MCYIVIYPLAFSNSRLLAHLPQPHNLPGAGLYTLKGSQMSIGQATTDPALEVANTRLPLSDNSPDIQPEKFNIASQLCKVWGKWSGDESIDVILDALEDGE